MSSKIELYAVIGLFFLIFLVLLTATLIISHQWGGSNNYKEAARWLNIISIIFLFIFFFIALIGLLKKEKTVASAESIVRSVQRASR